MIPGIAPAIITRSGGGDGMLYQEDFAGFNIGDGRSEMQAAGWAVSSVQSSLVPGIETDAGSPTGRRAAFVSQYNVWYLNERLDISQAIADAGWQSLEVLTLTRANRGLYASLTGYAENMGYPGLGWGLLTRNNGRYYLPPSDGDLTANGAEVARDIADSSLVWSRIRFETPNILSAKVWPDGSPEPAAWVSDDYPVSWDADLLGLGFYGNREGYLYLIGFGVGTDRPAEVPWV